MPSGPRRRSLLASAAGVALVAGCSGPPGEAGDERSALSAAERARARAARDSAELAARYDAVIAAHPALAGRLVPLRDEVVEHARAFGGGSGGRASATPSASASGSPAPAVPVPADEKGALAELARAERELADRRAGTLTDLPGESARLLASVAASGAVHAYLLTEGEG
jgi:hypothetical protein